MTEDLGNVRTQVADDVLMPDHVWADKPLDWFIGKYVKRHFDAIAHNERGEAQCMRESMWIKVDCIDRGILGGTLENAPFLHTLFEFGDRVNAFPFEVVDVRDSDFEAVDAQ